MSLQFKGQCQIQFKRLVTNVIMTKYKDNPINNNKVIANNIKFQAHYKSGAISLFS